MREYRWIDRKPFSMSGILLYEHTNKWSDDCIFLSDKDVRLLVESMRYIDGIHRLTDDQMDYEFISEGIFYRLVTFCNGESQIEITKVGDHRISNPMEMKSHIGVIDKFIESTGL